MIFVSLGTQEFQMNRVLAELDRLVGDGTVTAPVFAQSGHSTYVPKNFQFERFIGMDQFHDLIRNSELVISHGGTGTIVSAIKAGKKVIAIPRLKKLGEHVDDHQVELIEMFSSKQYIKSIDDISELAGVMREIESFTPAPYESGNERIKGIIAGFIKSVENKKKRK